MSSDGGRQTIRWICHYPPRRHIDDAGGKRCECSALALSCDRFQCEPTVGESGCQTNGCPFTAGFGSSRSASTAERPRCSSCRCC